MTTINDLLTLKRINEMTENELNMLAAFELGMLDGFTTGAHSELAADLADSVHYAYLRGFDAGVELYCKTQEQAA